VNFKFLNMKIFIGSDHGGFELKEILREYLASQNHEVSDEGCFSTDSVDYPDIAKKVSKKVLENKNSKGILMCGTGIGISISANKIKGIRAALCGNEYMAKMAREHNDANILCLGGRVIGSELGKSIIDTFLKNKFNDEERHKRRVEKMEEK